MLPRRRILGGGGQDIVFINFNDGISWIKVNNVTYYSSTEFEYEKGSTITWSAGCSTGYKMGTASGTINNASGKVTISPTCTYMGNYNITVTKSTGVASITVNGTNYTSSRTLSIAYGTSVSWSAVASAGYELDNDRGSFTVTKAQSIAPSATYMGYFDITVTVPSGVTITVNGTKYTSSTVLSLLYGTSVTWSATIPSGYSSSGSTSGSFTVWSAREITVNAKYEGYKTVTVGSIDSTCTLKLGGATVSTGSTKSVLYGGTLSVSVSTTTRPGGSIVSVTAYYTINGYGRSRQGQTSYSSTETITSDCTITAGWTMAE